MSQRGLITNLKLYYEVMRKQGRAGLSMRLRLFLFLILFLSAIMLGVLVILCLTGVFAGDHFEHRLVLENELQHTAGNIEKDFRGFSVQAVDLAKELATSIEANLVRNNHSIDSLQHNPQLLESILASEIQRLTSALERSRTSGVFLILDATINPALPAAENSRAGVYLKNMEPNIVNKMSAYLSYGLGPMGIARENSIRILPQWQMELDVTMVPEIFQVMYVAKESSLPVSRLYYWSEGLSLLKGKEQATLCMVPLVSSDGTVFGLCGLEVSEMLFKLSYNPTTEKYDHLFSLFAPLRDEKLGLSGALFAGHFAAGPEAPSSIDAEIIASPGGFISFEQSEQGSYVGLLQKVSLYPSDSPYHDQAWVVALMLPSYGLEMLTSEKNRMLTLGFSVLMLVSSCLALLISQRYIRPVVAGLEQLRKPNPDEQIRIPEIDDLIQFLAVQDQAPPLPKKSLHYQPSNSNLYLEFERNIKTLSPAEKRVFDLYVHGHTGQKIAEILCLSVNTIKTHNRRIYEKLNVSSRNELMVYIRMMEEAGSINEKA